MAAYYIGYVFTLTVVLVLIAELWRVRDRAWALPALLVYLTVITWYFVDYVAYGSKYQEFTPSLINFVYGQVLIFVLAFRVLLFTFAWRMELRKTFRTPTSLQPESVFVLTVFAWFILFVCAVYRMDWDFIGALFPTNARNGNLMWLRAAAADAGPTGFLVSTGGYLYLLACAIFGILFVAMRSLQYKIAAAAMMALTWPFFLLSGTRNQFLAVSMPWVFCYGLLGRQKPVIRIVVLALCFLFVDFAFQIIIGYRGVGLLAIFEEEEIAQTSDTFVEEERESGHQGLNMLQELCYENIFLETGQVELTWGWDYLVQASGFVPRAIWPGKPMMGIEYAKARGFGGGTADTGVVATVSTGLIGQGVIEFGPFFGPIAPAIFMALWCGLLGRWWQQRASLLRLSLCLVALGITFNLGRDITNIALWPVLFAYMLVWLLEKNLLTRSVLPLNLRPKAKARPAPPTRPIRRLAATQAQDPGTVSPENPAPLA